MAQKCLITRKNYTWKNFHVRDFRFEIRFKTFCIDSDPKIPTKRIFSTKFFLNLSFFTILAILAEKRLSPTKIKTRSWPFWNFSTPKLKKLSYKPFAQWYKGHFKPATRSLTWKMWNRITLCDFSQNSICQSQSQAWSDRFATFHLTNISIANVR